MNLSILVSRLFLQIYMFLISIIALIVTILTFHISIFSPIEISDIHNLLFFIFVFCFFIFQTAHLNEKITNTIAFNYKIVKKGDKYFIKYLTLAYFFIPKWIYAFSKVKKISYGYDSFRDEIKYEEKQIRKYKSINKAEKGIQKHKEKLNKNLKNCLKPIKIEFVN